MAERGRALDAKEFDQAYLTVGDFYLRMGDGDSAIREYKEGIVKDAKAKWDVDNFRAIPGEGADMNG